MAKVGVVGPKELLLPVLDLVRESGVFQVEAESRELAAEEKGVHPHRPDLESVARRLFYEDLLRKIDELSPCLTDHPGRESFLEPENALDAIAHVVDKHRLSCRELCRNREQLWQERERLKRQTQFVSAIAPLMEGAADSSLGFFGVTVRDPADLDRLMQLLSDLTGGRYEIMTTTAADGTLVALIALPPQFADRVRRLLEEERIPELAFPEQYRDRPLPEQTRRLQERLLQVTDETARVEADVERFAHRWGPIYHAIQQWLEDRLSLLRATGLIHETDFCFLLHGWLPVPDLERLRAGIGEKFGGSVVVEELQVLEEDLAQVPVSISNPAYFRPFELFSRLLPLPFYTSYDPTLFIGLFFPIFFGMILGDAGYGGLILAGSLALRRYARQRDLRDAAAILFISAWYAIGFGLLYGEFFGIAPSWPFLAGIAVVDRRHAVLPMLIFSVSVGVAHLILGLFLGALGALRRKEPREALLKLANLALLVFLAGAAISRLAPFPAPVTRSLDLAALAAVVAALLAGGLLAPLEMLKHIGNVVSYARIMAIGLASVLIAHVANRLAGLSGEMIFGAVAAGLLHLVNLVLGIFSPTIHVLRLHYVEFFGKFMSYGGRRFEPFRRPGLPHPPPLPRRRAGP
ncbi:ATPase [Geomonas sp. Red875]|uniref:ATPase n=2 Tax=Geomesophilobacter sediminis TaxID=2798584 RepID=A0A8J7IYE5_9BACT|nr:ATPase [Geomesophilobacter sediminis]